MDEDLQKLIRLQTLQRNAILYRNDVQLYKVMKQTCLLELQNLMKVEMDIAQTVLKMPDSKKPEQLPDVCIQQNLSLRGELEDMIKECRIVKEAAMNI